MRDLVLTVFIVGLLPYCFARPWIGVLSWYWIGLMSPHKLTWGFARDMPFAMAVAIATLAGLVVTRDRRAIPWNTSLVLLLLLFGWFTMTSFFAWMPDNAWDQWTRVMKIILMTFISTTLIYGRNRVRALLIVIALSIGFFGVKGGIFTLRSGGVDHVLGPPGSFIEGNTFLGLALVMVVPLLIFLAREEQRKWIKRMFYATAMFSILAAVFTYSRGALLGLGMVVPLLFMKSQKKFLVIALVIPLAIFGKDLVPEKLYKRTDTIGTYEEDYSAMQRLASWSVGLNVAERHPLTGAGFDFESYPDPSRWFGYMDQKYAKFIWIPQAAHSIYFQMLGQHGFVAFGLFIGMLISALLTLQRLKRQKHNPETKWIAEYASAIQISLLGYMVSGAFINVAYFDLMYIMIAFTALLQREAKSVLETGHDAAQVKDAAVKAKPKSFVRPQRLPEALPAKNETHITPWRANS